MDIEEFIKLIPEAPRGRTYVDIRRAAKAFDVKTADDLLSHGAYEMLKVKRVGTATVRAIRERCVLIGLKWH